MGGSGTRTPRKTSTPPLASVKLPSWKARIFRRFIRRLQPGHIPLLARFFDEELDVRVDTLELAVLGIPT